jgi:hypothetical protein
MRIKASIPGFFICTSGSFIQISAESSLDDGNAFPDYSYFSYLCVLLFLYDVLQQKQRIFTTFKKYDGIDKRIQQYFLYRISLVSAFYGETFEYCHYL